MKKEVLKIIVSSLIFFISFQVMYSNSVNLTYCLFSEQNEEINNSYKSPTTEVLNYLNSEEYAFKHYLDTAINYLSLENKDASLEQIAKYNSIYPKGESSTPGGWCTEFVTWGLLEADEYLGTNHVGTTYPLLDSGYQAARWFSKQNRLYTEEDYVPKRGDMMFFQYYDSIIDHTALVTGTKEENGVIYVLTIEGNIPSLSDKGIKERVIPLDDKYIYGYGSYE